MTLMCMKVEFLTGTDITTAVKEAKVMAQKFDLAYVRFNFNGVSVSVGQCADPEEAYLKYTSADKYLILN